jgi:hypothetical protein
MKQTYSLVTALLLTAGLQAQTTGLDFTANDCDGAPHQLFADLDAGNAVIIDLVMMNCQPCVTASHGITDDVIPNTSDPSRVKFYSIGYTNSITCSQMNTWKTTNGFTHPVFAGMSAQTTYYGGMGMPTVIVLGGGAHTVFYNELGYSASNNPALIQAINDALGAQVGIAESTIAQVAISPNPATDRLSLTDKRWIRATISDAQGRLAWSGGIVAGIIDILALPAGMYVVNMTDASGAQGTARFEKQ